MALLVCAPTCVSAAPQFSVNAPQRLKLGEPLQIEVTVDEPLAQLKATIIDPSTTQKRATKTWRRTRTNGRYTVQTKLGEGRHRLTLMLEGKQGNEASRIEFPINIIVVRPLDVQVSTAGLNPKLGVLKLTAKSRISAVSVEVFDRAGASFHVQTYDFSDEPKSGAFDVAFESIPDDTIFRLELKVEDIAGQWRRFKFVRWFTEIPHEDVVFETAKWSISDSESRKLDKDILLLKREVTAFRNTVGRADVDFDVTLYIGGMTDTVGSKSDNRRLSLRRARAIGLYFRQHGFKMPIRIAGFGESAPRVQTADETPEARNRRAVYILTSGTAPRLTPPNGRWETL